MEETRKNLRRFLARKVRLMYRTLRRVGVSRSIARRCARQYRAELS